MLILHSIHGKVRAGAKRGKSLGFPTANISLHKIIPEGIYISQVSLFKKIYPAATFVGEEKICESYILNFHKNIYGQWITVKLLKKVRDNKKFVDEKSLIEAIKDDVEITKQFFAVDE